MLQKGWNVIITLTLTELDIRGLASLAERKARYVTKDRAYWLRLRDDLLLAIPSEPLPGLKQHNEHGEQADFKTQR